MLKRYVSKGRRARASRNRRAEVKLLVKNMHMTGDQASSEGKLF